MTTAIPFFKPVKYKNNLYVDGGLRQFTFRNIFKNYLAFNIKGGTCKIDNVYF